MLTEMVMATLFVNVFGAALTLPFIAAQNLLSRSLQTEPRDAMGGAGPSRETNGLSPSKAANRRQSSQPAECAIDNAWPVLPRGRENQIAAACREANL